MTGKDFRHIVYLLLAGIAIFLLSATAVSSISQWRESQVFFAQPLEQPFIHTGDGRPTQNLKPEAYFYMHIKVFFPKACHSAFIQTRVFKITDGKVDVLYSFPMSMARIISGNVEFNELMHLPPGLPPGDYILRRFMFTNCGAGNTVVYPDARFTIVAE